MRGRLDSLKTNLSIPIVPGQLNAGWGKVNITPSETVPLAGYGARGSVLTHILDSSYVRVIVLRTPKVQLALVGLDLLIVHPLLKQEVSKRLSKTWPGRIYYTSTHTHSGQGGWAPHLGGSIFAGSFDPTQVTKLAEAITGAIIEAESRLQPVETSYFRSDVPGLVKNRLAREKGSVDDRFQGLSFTSGEHETVFGTFSAHATCHGKENLALSSDYPGVWSNLLEQNGKKLGLFAAGSVGSMKANADPRGSACSQLVGQALANAYDRTETEKLSVSQLTAFDLPLILPEPTLKVASGFSLHPWLFKQLMGDYPAHLSVAVIGKVIMLGFPCDFSGELSTKLYDYACKRGHHLIITSFNGAYTGYAIKDEWYDLDKPESRDMSWHGPYFGSYLSWCAEQLISTITSAPATHALTDKQTRP